MNISSFGRRWITLANATIGRSALGLGAAAVADYSEGSWTPVFTFATPGNLSVAYTVQSGIYTKIGNIVSVTYQITTSTFTHTTASGNATINGLPFTSANNGLRPRGPLIWQGITKATYTDMAMSIAPNTSAIIFTASGSGVATAGVTAADMPTGGSVVLGGTMIYTV